MIRRRPSILTIVLALALLPMAAAAVAAPLGLDQCLELAYRHSPELASSRQQLISSRAGLLAAYGNFMPNLGSSVGYSHQYVGPKPASLQYNTITQEFFTLDPIESRDYEYYNFSLNGDITLFSGFSRWANLSSQRYTLAAGEAELAGTRHGVESAVIQAYYNLVKAQLQVRQGKSTLKANQEL